MPFSRSNAPRALPALLLTIPLACAAADGSALDLQPKSEIRRAQRTEPLRQPRDVPKIASYQLSARLDTDAHLVAAQGSIRWTNASTKPAEELYFHLYLNAFQSNRTLFMRAPRQSRTGLALGDPGGIEVQKLSSPRFGSVNLWERAAPHSPDDPEDATDIRLPLPSPLLPGETIELDIEFTAKLPRIVERTGFSGSFHMVAQWFPKLARREPDGRWAHFAFHPHAEFYADFGNYDVSLDVPARFVVGATGERKSLEETGTRRVERYVAEGVHDFAWTAWDDFEVERRRIGGVDVILLAPPRSGPARAVTWTTLEHGLPFFSERYGPYAYPTLTVVYPPAFAKGAGGMEYPTLITTGGYVRWPQLGVRFIEQVTVHELAHQWFQGMLASNEQAAPFLDEGLTSYAEWTALRECFGDGSLFELLGFSLSAEAFGRVVTLEAGQREVIAQPAASFSSMRSLAAHVYSATALALTTLARVYGEKSMEDALREYAETHRLSHPTPDDLFQSVRRNLGEQAERALRTLLYEKGTIDFAVTELTSERHPSASPQWVSRTVVTRQGNLELPVTLRLDLESGVRLERRWDGSGESFTLEITEEAPVIRVVVDPENAVLVDRDRFNNTRTAPGYVASKSSSQKAWYFAELLLHALGS